jgi:ribosomal protein L2
VVESIGLENRRTLGYRGFESHPACALFMRPTSPSLSSSQASGFPITLSRLPLPSSLRTGRSSSASAGRNAEGHITVRHRGGGHKRAHRLLD